MPKRDQKAGISRVNHSQSKLSESNFKSSTLKSSGNEEEIMNILSQIEETDQSLYDELCEVLVLKEVQHHQAYRDWTVLRGRNDCFLKAQSHLNQIE